MIDRQRDTRGQILEATLVLLERLGADAMSIRDVCRATGVTAPTVYHHFGDKQGLLEAVAAEGFARYLGAKRDTVSGADPVENLWRAWDVHVGFGLAHPAFYRLMFGAPLAEERPPAREARRVLVGMLAGLAETGRLRLPVEDAATMIHTAAVGTTLMLLSFPEGPGTARLSERMREAVFASVLRQDVPSHESSAVSELARTLLASLSAGSLTGLTPGERGILLELLEKLSG